MKFLIAYDGSAASKSAIEKVKLFLRPGREDRVYIVTFSVPLERAKVSLEELANLEESFRAMGEDIKVSTDIIVLGAESIRNGIGEKLCEMVEFNSFDYLVMGSRGLNAIASKIFGSSSEYCLHHCKCSIIIEHYHYH